VRNRPVCCAVCSLELACRASRLPVEHHRVWRSAISRTISRYSLRLPQPRKTECKGTQDWRSTTSPRRRGRPANTSTDDTIAAVLASARRLFAAKGYAGTTNREICAVQALLELKCGTRELVHTASAETSIGR